MDPNNPLLIAWSWFCFFLLGFGGWYVHHFLLLFIVLQKYSALLFIYPSDLIFEVKNEMHISRLATSHLQSHPNPLLHTKPRRIYIITRYRNILNSLFLEAPLFVTVLPEGANLRYVFPFLTKSPRTPPSLLP